MTMRISGDYWRRRRRYRGERTAESIISRRMRGCVRCAAAVRW